MSGVGVFDHSLMFISTGNLTATATFPASGLIVRGTAVEGLAVRIAVPSTVGVSGQLLFAITGSEDNSTYRTIATYPKGAQSWASGGKEFVIPFAGAHPTVKYVKLSVTVTTSAGISLPTGGNWGAAKAGIVERQHADFTRAVNFEEVASA